MVASSSRLALLPAYRPARLLRSLACTLMISPSLCTLRSVVDTTTMYLREQERRGGGRCK